MTKIFATDLLEVEQTVADIIKEVAPNRTVDLTEHQMERIEKKVQEAIVNRFAKKMEEELLDGNSVEFKGNFNVKVTASTVTKTKNGAPKRKISVQTRTAMNDKLNN